MTVKIDLLKLCKYILRRAWILLICAVIGFGGMYYKAVFMQRDMYTANATMYVYNGNPNVVNYQYTNTTDLNTAVMLVDTYKVVIRSNKVLNSVAERLGNGIPVEYISRSLSFGSVSDTGVMTISSTTPDPQLSMDICNAVADIAPAEILRVVSAGNVQVVDYAELPEEPNSKGGLKNGLIGALAGIVLSGGILVLLFLLNRKLSDSKELTENYTLPLLSVIGKVSKEEEKNHFLISEEADMRRLSEYTKLRINLKSAMKGKIKTVLISSAVPGECKSTVSANLAISCAMTGKKILLIDADMRKPSQSKIFNVSRRLPGFSDMLTEDEMLQDTLIKNVRDNLDFLPAGAIPHNPSELLDSEKMRNLLKTLQLVCEYDLILIDLPPINVVPDALILSHADAAMLFVTRGDYSDHREIRKALLAAEFAEIDILGMVMTCATRHNDDSYSYHYSHYYSSYEQNNNDGTNGGSGTNSGSGRKRRHHRGNGRQYL